MCFNVICHVERVQSVHTDQEDMIYIGRVSGCVESHPGKHTEGDLF